MNLDKLQAIKEKARAAGRNVKFRGVVLELVEELLGSWAALHDLSQDAGGALCKEPEHSCENKWQCELCEARRRCEYKAAGVLEMATLFNELASAFTQYVRGDNSSLYLYDVHKLLVRADREINTATWNLRFARDRAGER